MKNYGKIKKALLDLLEKRVLVLDGAMGTMIQQHHLEEKDFRSHRFENHPMALKGNYDLLSVTRPDIIKEIHQQYLEAGSDLIETNTFNANAISMADYGLRDIVPEMNLKSAEIACEAASEIMKKNPSKPRFVLGAMGPTPKLASIELNANSQKNRGVEFQKLKKAYSEQAKALIQGGVDVLLIETITDKMNCNAAIMAILELNQEINEEIPIMISGTIINNSGLTLAGQTPEDFWNSVQYANPISIGFNCGVGGESMRAPLESLNQVASCKVSIYPNAGLPNEMGFYDESPEYIAKILKGYVSSGLVNLIGGCCGTTPEYIRMMARSLLS